MKRAKPTFAAVLLISLAPLLGAAHEVPLAPTTRPATRPLTPAILPAGPTESAPHGQGNVYAPDVLFHAGVYRMWYGGQGKDGHDRIHYAESADGATWVRKGVAIDHGSANHVNDPSVVRVGKTLFLYYTRADRDVRDVVALATSDDDGRSWADRGVVLSPGTANEWDGLLVGRPSVTYEEPAGPPASTGSAASTAPTHSATPAGRGRFCMWYDGRKDLPAGAPAKGVPTSPTSRRAVGLATSDDGLHWTKHPANPVFGDDAGGVAVARVGERYAADHFDGDRYLMTYESHAGTQLATGPDGVTWHRRGLWVPRTGGPGDAFGHVTPFLLVEDGVPTRLFVGAARAATWDHNTIGVVDLRAK